MFVSEGLTPHRMQGQSLALRGSLFYCLDQPSPELPEARVFLDLAGRQRAVVFIPDGLLLIRDGCVAWADHYAQGLTRLPPECRVLDYSGRLVMPGFVDTHTHYPQVNIIGQMGHTLLDWLSQYTFPAEARFSDARHAAQTAEFFIRELCRHGVTTASVFATVHAPSVDAFFTAAHRKGMRMICGKVLMNQHCPSNLSDAPGDGIAESQRLIDRWHGKDRLRYALTPRFVPTSSPAQMQAVGEVFQSSQGLHLQSHLAENLDEVDWVKTLYPKSRSYLEVYDQFDQLGRGSIMAHCIYIDDDDRRCMAASQTAIAFCPSSNLFLGSGLFDLRSAQAAGIAVGLGSDVGGGTSPNMFKTMLDAYKVLKLGHQTLQPEMAFYLATLGGAHALGLEALIGNFLPGKEADVIVVNPQATPLLRQRLDRFSLNQSRGLTEVLSALITLGDERCIEACFIQGRPCDTDDRA